MMRLGVGLPLYPDLEYLERAAPLLEEEADYFEVNPETLWRSRNGRLERNGFHPIFAEIRDRSRKPFVAHGLDFSIGTADEDAERVSAWLERIRDDHETFRFAWMTEHLGWTTTDGLQSVLPLPLPFTDEAVAAVAGRMRRLASIVPTVGFENNVTYFALGEIRDEPAFFNAICRATPCGMLLDLHNAWTQCRNFGIDPIEYVDRIELDPVVQIHLSGGSESDPDWVPSKRVFRLDSHDGPVPEEVWRLLEHVRPRCSNLGGIVVERLNGTFESPEEIRGELRRAKEIFRC